MTARLVTCTVADVDDLGSFRLLRLDGTDLAIPAPGQFAMVRDPDGRTLLPRAAGVFVHPRGGAGLLVVGTNRIGSIATATSLTILAPLGHGFDLSELDPASTLLVTAGFGISAVIDVPSRLRARPRLIAAFSDPSQAAALALVEADAAVAVSSEDALARLAADLDSGSITDVLVAGPDMLVRGAARLGAACGARVQAALEAPMACGFGGCYGCVVELDGTWKRACVEGPVVAGARLR